VYTTSVLIFCLSNKLRKQDLKYLLVTHIISINTNFMVRITDDEFQTSTKMISQGQSLTQKHLQCWTFLKQKQLPPVCTTGCTVQGLNPSGGKIFCTRPDWPWGPSSLLYNGYWVFPWGKTVVVWH